MASPHGPDDLVQPLGRLTGAMFPNLSTEELTTLLQVFLDEGYERAAAMTNPTVDRVDAAAIAWAYAQAYEILWQRLSFNPSSASVEGQVQQSYTNQQIAAFEKLRADWLASFNSFFTPVNSSDAIGSANSAVTSTPTIYTF